MASVRAELNPHEIHLLHSWSQEEKPVSLPVEINGINYKTKISARPDNALAPQESPETEAVYETTTETQTQLYLIFVATGTNRSHGEHFNGSISIIYDQSLHHFYFENNDGETHPNMPAELMAVILHTLETQQQAEAPTVAEHTFHQPVA